MSCTMVAAVLAVSCGSGESAPSGSTGTGAGTSSSSTGAGGSGGASGVVTDVRGDRYCEVLLGRLDGATVHVDVYNTYGLGDCPDAAWKALDGATIKANQMVDAVILNGPRYWLMDSFQKSMLVDPTVVTFGTLEMRLAGKIDVPFADVAGGSKPYVTRTVARTTSWVYDAGKPVYELVDPQGRVFDMQSYSVQKTAQTEASLATLGSQLVLPTGWSYRTRVLDAPLTVTAVNAMATVVQDDLANTYQLSQQ